MIIIKPPLFVEASGFIGRFKGYMLSSQAEVDSALLFRNCKALHTYFMKFNLDMFFLNELGEVLHIERLVGPWKFRFFHGAVHVIEVPSNRLSEFGFDQVCVGYKFHINL